MRQECIAIVIVKNNPSKYICEFEGCKVPKSTSRMLAVHLIDLLDTTTVNGSSTVIVIHPSQSTAARPASPPYRDFASSIARNCVETATRCETL